MRVNLLISLCVVMTGLQGIGAIIIPGEREGTPSSACFDNDNTMTASCGQDQIVITSFYQGYKGQSLMCPNDGTATGSCCSYDSVTDCLEVDTSTSVYSDELSGRTSGLVPTTNAIASTCSHSTYTPVSSFNQLNYQCIPDSRTFQMCTTESYTNDAGTPIYIQNRDYKQGTSILSSDTSCSCSVEVMSSTSDTSLYTLLMDLQNSVADCQQAISFSDGAAVVKSFSCQVPTYNTVAMETLTGPYHVINITNSNSMSTGKFMVGLQGTDANTTIKINCPAVLRLDCGTLPNPAHGEVTVTNSFYQGSATYTCNTGYTITSGDETRTCQLNEAWSGQPVTCVFDCGTVSGPSSGSVNITGTSPGSTATYICDSNTSLVGNSTRVCVDATGWSGTVPTCETSTLSTVTTPDTSESDDDDDQTVGIVVGVVFGTVLLIIALVVVVCWYTHRCTCNQT